MPAGVEVGAVNKVPNTPRRLCLRVRPLTLRRLAKTRADRHSERGLLRALIAAPEQLT